MHTARNGMCVGIRGEGGNSQGSKAVRAFGTERNHGTGRPAQWNGGTVFLTAVGWTSLLYRIRAEERLLAQDAGWAAYLGAVPFRLLPGLW